MTLDWQRIVEFALGLPGTEGRPAMEGRRSRLVRYDSADPERLLRMIEQAQEACLARPKARPGEMG